MTTINRYFLFLVPVLIFILWMLFPVKGSTHIAETKTVDLVPCLHETAETENSEIIVVSEPSEEDLLEEYYYDSLETLAICVEAEAGNQGLYGKRLVVDVILNRVDSPDFPNDIESVIYQKLGDVPMFSTTEDGAMDRVTDISDETFEAINMELKHRTDSKILYFTAGEYNEYCIPAYPYKDHYFGY